MMNDAPTGFRDQLRQAAYARLMAVEKLQAGLVEARTSVQKKMILDEILENCVRTIRQVGEGGDEYLITQTYLNMAFVLFDLAELAETAEEKENLYRQCAQNCDLAGAAALKSEFTLLAMDFLPEVITLLVQVMDRVQSPLLKSVQLSFARYIEVYDKAGEQQKKDRQQAAQDLYTAQLLHLGSRDVESQAERSVITLKVLELAQGVRRVALGASDRELAEQAESFIKEVETER